jgi:hypothetical protein
MGDESAMTAAQQQQPATAAPKKRFIGKAKAEALRRQALLQKEKKEGVSIEDGIVALKGSPVSFGLLLTRSNTTEGRKSSKPDTYRHVGG